MKNLGKIILLFLMAMPLMADVKVSVDSDSIVRGDKVVFTISISGSGKVRFPPIDNVCGYSVEGSGKEESTVFNNGNYERELKLMYVFMPQKSCTIESFNISMNDKEFKTNTINVTVAKMSITKNEPFVANITTPKKSFYVGEPFEMKLSLKNRQNINVLKDGVSLPQSKNLWIKSQGQEKTHMKDGYKVKANIFAMSAQQSGKLSLGPIRWDVRVRSKSRDSWGMYLNSTKVRTVFSNEIEIEIKDLPSGISIAGDLAIKASVDKTEIEAGSAVNLNIEVKGHANIEDIQTFTFHVDDAQAFNEDPKITHYLQDEKYFGVFTQKSAIVAQRDFTIPSFEIKYMDVKTDTVKTIKTKPIKIKVLNSISVKADDLNIVRPDNLHVETNSNANTLNTLQIIFLVLGGFVLGLVVSLLPFRKVFKKDKTKKHIAAKETKETLQLLMANIHVDSEIEDMVKDLSENLYEGKKNKIDMKKLKEILKKLQG